MLKYASASIALLAFCNPALAAAGCATPSEASALKTAVMQQEMMVAALQCKESAAYNRFVNTYRPELQSSDASLKAFFVRRGGEHGEAGYDAFKTKAANLSALENARDAGAFCADARGLLQAALAHRGNLMSFVEQRSLASDMGNVCIESKPRPVLAKLEDKPASAVKAIAVAAPAAAPPLAAPVKVAQTAPAPAPREVAVAGVPSHSVPAIPYSRDRDEDFGPPPEPQVERRELARAEPAVRPRPQFRPEAAVDDEADDIAPSYVEEEAPLPPRPRYYAVRERRYDDGYAYMPPRPAYGPPPGWRDYPARAPYRWYPRGYSNW